MIEPRLLNHCISITRQGGHVAAGVDPAPHRVFPTHAHKLIIKKNTTLNSKAHLEHSERTDIVVRRFVRTGSL